MQTHMWQNLGLNPALQTFGGVDPGYISFFERGIRCTVDLEDEEILDGSNVRYQR